MNTPVPASVKSDFLRIMLERGYYHQATDLEALDKALLAGGLVGYNGYDATADSLHVGHLLPTMIQRWLQKTGGRPILLMGGGTTRIGDPSGRDETRQLLTDEVIAANIAGIRTVFDRLFDFGPSGARLVNNAEWLDRLEYISFLRDIGRHFTINRMLTFDSVRLRLDREQPLTFLEFNYMILQAYDFVELSRRYGCVLQTGGSDQWGNIVNGVDLGRRIANRDLFGLTCPLLTTASGAKMGKTAAGAVWLNRERLSDWDFWQYWRNTEDADVGRFLKLFTELPLDEIARLEALQGAEINEAKKILATEVTRLVRGDEAADAAAETARRTFEQGALAEGLPTVELPADELAAGVAVYGLLAKAGLVASNGEARRQIKQAAVRVNDQPVTDEFAKVGSGDLTADGVIKLSVGRKRHALVKPA
ncbi:tyrosine--tRNA ligase [Rhodospirillum centenum]|uniref:Tyrosine--tRNA ligase n=1 Tax=Rhodospirillum centenum (strain ATCC 51521 / SW) TaxID=414684 RepID=B6INC7_RHOCS|nr:tyrosine--tRNA ligase [Rhodospirillum centenum]ACI99024.1 tyrosyl-tRNA synthetase TyrS [Rhodospirillum centenum SW]